MTQTETKNTQKQFSPDRLIAEIHQHSDTKEKWLECNPDEKRQVLRIVAGCADHACLLRAMKIVKGETNPDMKILELRKSRTGRAKGKYLYEVVDGDTVIAARRSNRKYVACNVVKIGDRFETPAFYGRPELVKDIPPGIQAADVYALAQVTDRRGR